MADPPQLDLLVLGSGVAGLSAACRAAAAPGPGGAGLRVGVLTKAELSQSATRWAQGGVAAVLGGDEDSADLHLADTLAAGAGLCDLDSVRVLVDEGPSRVNELIALGAVFDRDHEGRLLRAREGGHSLPRVVHAGGAATGAEIERALVEAVRATAVAVLEGWFAVELLVDDGPGGRRCRGVAALDPGGVRRVVRADHVLVATGGAGQLFAVTTNPSQATGDGVAMALRAAVPVADLEFVQFHPTALHHPAMPRPLLSEALRGHGAVIRDLDGERFVDELAPRDVVSRAITARMLDQGADHVWLDATLLEGFEERFPTIAASLRGVGLDPSGEWLPIAPAAHYLTGGIVTDLDGASALAGLWACGEVACTGVHGANRLGSNSLLEGMVFAPRVVEAILRGKDSPEPTGAMRAVLSGVGGVPGRSLAPGPGTGRLLRPGGAATAPDRRPTPPDPTGRAHGGPAYSAPEATGRGQAGPRASSATGLHQSGGGVVKEREVLQRAMSEGAGVLRSASSLSQVAEAVAAAEGAEDPEVANLATVGRTLVAAAAAREESRGAHFRTDFPGTDESFVVRLVQP